MKPPDVFERLLARWRGEAETYRKRGLNSAARMAKTFADELEATWRAWQSEPLTLDEAAEETGYSYSRLQRLVSSGQLRNVGRKNAPRVRRCDLPRKPAAQVVVQVSPNGG